MKTKMMKRAAAFAASVLMIGAMAVPAFAVDTNLTAQEGEDVTPIKLGDSMTVTKDLYLFNTAGKEIYAPDITYTYTLSAGSDGKTITGKTFDPTDVPEDATVSVQTLAGIDGGVLLNGSAEKAEFTIADGGLHSTTKEGETRTAKITSNLEITTDASKFTKAGVYRYEIKQTTKADAEAKGVTDIGSDATGDAWIDTAYLDVYVKRNDADTAYEVYGLVLSRAGDNDIEWTETASTDAAQKINCFDPDEYHTVNAKVTKHISGAMADKTQEFKFDMEGTAIAGSKFYWSKNGATETTDLTATSGAYTLTANLADSQYVDIIGIPMEGSPKLSVQETNISTETYSATYNMNNDEVVGPTSTKLDAGTGTLKFENAVIDCTKGTTKFEYDSIDFYNTLDAISPTGVLFRIAPYALMMTAGGVLIAVYLRSKKREDAEEMI